MVIKCEGSRWNRVASSVCSIVISTSGLMAAILNFGSWTTSCNVHGDTVKSGMVDTGVSRWNRGAITCRLKLFPLPVLLAAILNFGSLPLSTNVGQRRSTSANVGQRQACVHSVKSKSGVIENMLAAFGIVSQSITVQNLFPVPV